ncbi:putative ribonuclease H-like domain-containing protein [Tanacetum coccineum]
MQKNVLKHQFENFTTASNESLDKAYDRFQKLISQLEVHGAPISKEDINQKFLRSLPPSWNQIALIMRNKPDIDEIDIDDLYNNLRVYEDEMKRSSSSTSTSQNLAFLSSENTSSTNEVSTASGDFGVSTAGGISQVSTTPCAHDVACSFFAQPTTSPQLENEDFQQIDEDDLEELDLRWQVAMLTVRVKKFIQKTGRNLDFKEKRPFSIDKSKIECYNCHRKGHFARDCRSRRNQGRRSYGDNGRSNAPTNESSSQALVAQDGLGGYDWSNDFKVELVNYVLTMRARLEIQGYKLSLESLESRILVHEKNELALGEKYEFQNYELKCREIKINNLNLELEKVVKERDELKLKIEKWEESSKNLDELLNSQMSARDKTGLGYGTQLNEMSNNSKTDSEISLSVFDVRSSDEESTPANDRSSKADGYHVVPPPITGNFLTPRADISFAGLDEYAIRKKIIESKTTDLNTKTSETVVKEEGLEAIKGNYFDHVSNYMDHTAQKGQSRISLLQDHAVVDSDELKFNLFSVSQMCDKKNSVLFTKTECLILSPSFKLLDEILENQLNHHVKIIRYDNGTEFKNHAMNEFGAKKGIKREFSVARTPQHNGVAERKNRTLIEATRTMLADSLLPIPFLGHKSYRRIVLEKKGQHQMTKDEQDFHDELEKMIAQEVVTKALDDATRQAFEEEKEELLHLKRRAAHYHTYKLNVQCISNDGIFSGKHMMIMMVGSKMADFNNMDNTIDVSPIPTLRVHKDHPKGQILGDPKSAVQTRGKIQKASSVQQALVSYIYNQNRTNHKDHQNYLFACFLSQEEPKNISQALQDESWVEAMQEELLQFKLQKVWVLVDLPYGKKVWNVIKIDYDEVFAPVARIEAIRLFLAFASYMGFTVYQMDVKSAFLYGTIEEEVYVHQPPGFVDPAHPNKVYKVIKALYGLHQAPRAWYETLSSFLMENGFRRGTIDKTLFIKKKKSDIMLVQVYVDDIIFGSTKKSMCTEFEDCMHKRFQMSSMGELTFFLGLQVKQQPDGIFISQDKYVADILKKFDFWSIRTATTPIESNKPLVKDEDGVDVDVHVYRSMIGSLMYLTASRPDIMFAVCACARFQVTPKASHLNAVKRIFRYLKHQPKLGLWYPRDSPFELEAFSDSDYGGASLDIKSTTGGCQLLDRRLISWQCKKQTIMANSTIVAEYVAAANCCGQVLWIQNQMMDYGFNFMNTKLHIDNESTISVIKNPVAHSRTKHIEIRFHFIRDCYEKRLIEVIKIHTDHNVADFLTKGFDVTRFNFLVVSIGLLNLESLERDIDGTEELLLPDLFILWLTKVSTDSAKLVPLGKDSTAIKPLEKIPPRVLSVNCNGFFAFGYITAKVAGKPVNISEASIRSDLLFDDADGIDSLHNRAIFDAIQLMGHLDAKKKCVMYPRFFSFMVKKGKSFSGNVTPLFPSMLAQPTEDEGAVSERPSETQPTPSPPHLKGSGGNHEGQSSNDRSLSGNEDGLTLQSVYDLCVSLCKQVTNQAAQIKFEVLDQSAKEEA